ncbi:RNA polymerase sigma factor [Glycomyces sp. L485]|uniref:RNA polymerase sigma factor n=1 Tax=Glycomyces sp. L485 TaxID=2909235 RepID=UPI001F4AF314|nr:RNA polymerase sigma factor [Glycomyces sp. L485]MCH7231648.1 RNA polymerase sigma factor [Glycomyces sp. L485]
MLGTIDRTSLQELARAELPGLYALARYLTHTPSAAEELVQDTMVRACRSFASLKDVEAGPKWLRVIMTNVWRDQLRRDGRRPEEVLVDPSPEPGRFSLYQTLADEDPLPWSDTLHVDFLGAFSAEDIHLVLERVPERYRVPLLLRYMDGFDTGEICELLSLPPGTVYSLLHRGRRHFERTLWEYANESGLLEQAAGAERPPRKEA